MLAGVLVALACAALLWQYPLKTGWPQAGTAESLAALAGEKLDLNRADETALCSLPGIGPAKARAILAYRSEHGGFHSIDELLGVAGIGEPTLAKLRPYVCVG